MWGKAPDTLFNELELLWGSGRVRLNTMLPEQHVIDQVVGVVMMMVILITSACHI
jgi:hypothetical protein